MSTIKLRYSESRGLCVSAKDLIKALEYARHPNVWVTSKAADLGFVAGVHYWGSGNELMLTPVAALQLVSTTQAKNHDNVLKAVRTALHEHFLALLAEAEVLSDSMQLLKQHMQADHGLASAYEAHKISLRIEARNLDREFSRKQEQLQFANLTMTRAELASSIEQMWKLNFGILQRLKGYMLAMSDLSTEEAKALKEAK